jgi:hypothetical protein
LKHQAHGTIPTFLLEASVAYEADYYFYPAEDEAGE